ncbi:hypothetical protein CTAYLR_002387 [Chrysophaeum taylorii]|uniref:Uncharacterized protein n=1 Tax=Chrysophaeum taylorii TaxID=2483200 RepID=A0AAD7UI51_9STRA|nr:hypothetical protein CTAYLR_002387 [Chrysophaeum taylorii]
MRQLVAIVVVVVTAAFVAPPLSRRRVVPCNRRATLDAEAEFTARLAVVEALRGVVVEDTDVVSAGMVGGVSISDALLRVDLELPGGVEQAAAESLAAQCEAAAAATRDALADEGLIAATCSVDVFAVVGKPPPQEQEQQEVEASTGVVEATRRVKRIVAVSSCKGGVGKSTVAANVAFALSCKGLRVGIVDADVHGPSLPTLVGTPDVPGPGEPYVRLAPEIDEFGRELLEPLEKAGVKLMSFGFLGGDAPAMMRGSRVAGVVQQLATSVAWRDLDYLVIDMPPGTGDAQLTLCQHLAIDAAVVVTTPSKLAFADVVKGIKLFDEVSVPVVAVVENMAEFFPPTSETSREAKAFVERNLDAIDPARRSEFESDLAALLATPRRVFGDPHARKLREMWGIDHAIQIPLATDVAARADAGTPFVLVPPDRRSPEEARAADAVGVLVEAILAETTSEEDLRPPDLRFDGTSILATFAGETIQINPRELRLECRCALCVDEETGKLSPNRVPVPQDVKPLTIARNGNYAAAISWSDGHSSLYPFRAFVPAYAKKREQQQQRPLRHQTL